MCGITGILNQSGEPVSPVILKKMTDAIAHRGPDGEGIFIDGTLGVGHRRLAIIDLHPRHKIKQPIDIAQVLPLNQIVGFVGDPHTRQLA